MDEAGDRRPGDRMVRIGGALFLVGVVFVAVGVAAFLLGADDVPLVVTVPALLAPVGFAVALAGLVRQARAGQRRTREALAGQDDGAANRR